MTIERRVFAADELDVVLDPDGNPYDAGSAEFGPDRWQREHLADLHVPDGALRVMDGNAIQVDPWYFRDDAAAVDFDVDQLDAFVLWEVFEREGKGEPTRSVLGMIVSVPGTTVDAWQRAEFGYGTDGGTGGITSATAIQAASGLDDDAWFIPEGEYREIDVRDLDGIAGDETIIFSNGWGDGGFPMVRGLDADGRLVAVAVTDFRSPWRLAFPEGTPPPDVLEREAEIAQCLAGERDVEVWDTDDGVPWYQCTSDAV